MFRGLRADLAWLWIGYTGRALTYLGLTVVLTRELGPSGYGELALFLGVTLGVSQISGSWPFLSVPVFHARGISIRGATRAAARVAALATLAALLVAVPLAVVIYSDSLVSLLAIAVYGVALVGMQGVYSIFQADSRMNGIAVSQFLERGVTLLILAIAVVFFSVTLQAAEVIMAGSSAAVFAAILIRLQSRYRLFGKAPDEPHGARDVMSAVGAMGVVSACAYGVAWMDVFMLSAFLPSSDVGVYTLAYQIYTFVLQIGSLWAVATLPRHARQSAAGAELAEQLPVSRLVAGTRGWAGCMAVAGVAAVVALPIVFGDEFEDAATSLLILLAASGLTASYVAATPALIGAGETRFLAWISVAGVITNFLLNLALIPLIGPAGAAIATAAQGILVTAGVLVRVLGLRPAPQPLIAGLLPFAATCALAAAPDSLPLALIAGLTGLVFAAIGVRVFFGASLGRNFA